jgi:hypothetical protein
MRIVRESRGRSLIAECPPNLKAQGETLLNLAAEADAAGPGLRHGSIIEFGWAPVTLSADGDDLVLCEPDFGGDVTRLVPSVGGILQVLADQAALLNSLGVEGIAAKYDAGVVVRKGALDLPHIYLHRRAPVRSDDSGWYIGPADDNAAPDEAELDAMPVYRLLQLRPSLLKAMALPSEYLVVFAGSKIEAILDETGRSRFPNAVTP